MKAIILAAGRGSRMGPFTDSQPKCLTSVGGKTLFDIQTSELKKAKVEDLAVVKGYLADKWSRPGFHEFFNYRWCESNMVSSLLCAKEWLTNYPCIVSYSDIIYSSQTIEKLVECKHEICVAYDPNWKSLWESRFANPLDDAETFKIGGDGYLTEIGFKTDDFSEIQGQFMGLLKFTPVGWKSIENAISGLSAEEIDKMDTTSLLQFLIKKGEKIKTVGCVGPWFEFDSESDLAVYEGRFETNQRGNGRE